MERRRSNRIPCIALAALAAGCDARTNSDYQGEVLATLQGEVRLEGSSPPPGDEVELFYRNYGGWFGDTGTEDFLFVQRVSVTGEYPAAFQIELFEPPPEEALIDFGTDGEPDEARVGLGILTSSYECNYLSHDIPARCVFGTAPTMALVWAEDAIQPGSRAAEVVGTTLGAGYHLLQYRQTFPDDDAWQVCLSEAWEEAHERGDEDPTLNMHRTCPRYTLESEVPLDTSIMVQLSDGPVARYNYVGGSNTPDGALRLIDWRDQILGLGIVPGE